MAFLARSFQDVPASQLAAFDPQLTDFLKYFKSAYAYKENASGVAMWKARA